ncbi:hypothetical protein IEU95_15275 [Hoyosella rhizosphaerae]|uniref:hypothetical protein n=1 Tax=Hoyosella rhizosphaerae TaxID=1755582 RepID=UPI0016659208|nr:hypothetical protein [Hoyosella rhizosphaerae]MBN4928198.1 hypothetical protein [Hoyosella rhizosphaerae]
MGNEFGRRTRHRVIESRAETIAMRIGAVLFILGVVALVALFVVHITGGDPVLALYLGSMLSPLGLTVAFFTTVFSGSRSKVR